MINKIKNNLDKVYFVIALAYSCILPIVVMISNKFFLVSNIFEGFNKFITLLTILTIIVFIIDIIINKTCIFKIFKEKKSVIFLGLSFIFLTIAALKADDTNAAIFGVGIRFGGLISYVFYIFLAILGFKLNKKQRNIFFRTLIYANTFISILSLINSNTIRQFMPIEYAGTFANINHFSTVLVYIIIINIFTFYNDKNIFISTIDLICYGILSAMLVANNTFGSYLTVLFILIITIIYALKNKKQFKYMTMFIIFITLSLTLNINDKQIVKDNFNELAIDLDTIKTYHEQYVGDAEKEYYYMECCLQYTGSYRGELWYYAIEMIKHKPILGYGLENFTDDYRQYPLESNEDLPHNLILFLWLSGGIFTLLFYLIANTLIIGKNWRNIYLNNSMTVIWFIIIGHLIQSMFNNTLFYTTSLYAILFGMVYRNFDKEKDN